MSINSTKLPSAVDPLASLARDKLILSLWAPFAAKLLEPVALSNNVVSDSGVTNVSVTVNPTRYDGVRSYLSSTRVSSEQFTKNPRI